MVRIVPFGTILVKSEAHVQADTESATQDLDRLSRLARFVLEHRKRVGLFWLVVFIGGMLAAGPVGDRFTVDFSLPDQPGYETAKDLDQTYGNGEDSPYIPVVTAQTGTVADHQAQVDAVFDAIAQIPNSRVADFANTGDERFVTDDGRATFGLVYLPLPENFNDNPRDLIEEAVPPGLDQISVEVTGRNALAEGNDDSGGGDSGVLIEVLAGGAGALIVLAFVFASFLAFVPLVIAAVSILGTFLLLLPLTYVTDISAIVQFLVALIGLGVSIDYALLIVTRWREERQKGATNDEAVVTAVRTAGHAVIFSGVTVAVGLASVIVLPVPFLRSMGYGGMLIPLMATLVCLTLLPAILGGVGPRVDWPRIRHDDKASRSWSRWADLIVRRRWIAAGAALVVLGLLMVPFFDIKPGSPSAKSLASEGPAFDAFQTLENGGISDGILTPMEVLVRTDQGGDPAEVARQASEVDGVANTFVPQDGWQRDGRAVVEVIPERETVAGDSSEVVERVRDAVEDEPGVVGVGGLGAAQRDFSDAVYGNFPLVLTILALITFVLLARAFRSVLLALKAVVLNLVSLGATFGAMVLIWQKGYGSDEIFDISSTGAITFWVPMMVFAFLYGLSMDYEVFILSRMREEYDRTGSTSRAVVEGLGRTGRLVTCAALILFLAFAALASGPETDVKIMATGLGLGILLDATIVRALLVPALVSLFGKWNWWLPDRAAKVLRVEPSHALEERKEPELVS